MQCIQMSDFAVELIPIAFPHIWSIMNNVDLLDTFRGNKSYQPFITLKIEKFFNVIMENSEKHIILNYFYPVFTKDTVY